MKAVLFDLDGTVIDSEEGVTNCLRYAFKAKGLPDYDQAFLRSFIGPPFNVSFPEKLGVDMEETRWLTEKYRERYNPIGVYECYVYDGIPELIKKLREKGIFICVASSKPEGACKSILEKKGVLDLFDEVCGATPDGKIDSKEQVLNELYRRIKDKVPDKKDMILVGDTRFDVAGALAFGIDCVGVTFGFGTEEELKKAGAVAIANKPEEVYTYFENISWV